MKEFRNVVETGDSVAKMKCLPAGCARLVFADPPFNIDFGYDIYRDNKSSAEYLKWAGEWVSEAARLVMPGGSFWLAIGDEYAAHYKLILDATGFELRNWIIWRYGFGTHCEDKFSRCHAHILYYSRPGAARLWRPDRIKVESDRNGKYADARGKPGGKVPPDVWDYPRVCGTFKERLKLPEGETAHPCQMPVAILARIINVASDPGELVLDPFGGSGTTAVAAKRLGRSFWTCDLSDNYAKFIRDRLKTVSVFEDDEDDMTGLAAELGLT
jgi:DNA modification methylase